MKPEDIRVIDTMMGTTAGTTGKNRYAFLERALKDAESANMNFPAQYMFKDVPFSDQARDADGNLDEPPQGPDLLLPFMDRCSVEIAMVGIAASGEGEAFGASPSTPIASSRAVNLIRTVVSRRSERSGGSTTSSASRRSRRSRRDACRRCRSRAADVPDLRPVLRTRHPHLLLGVPGRACRLRLGVERIDQVMYDFPSSPS